MIPNDLKWFQIIPINPKGFQMILDDLKWPQLIQNYLNKTKHKKLRQLENKIFLFIWASVE